MSEEHHLIIAHAGRPVPGACEGLRLPQLERLLGRLAGGAQDEGTADPAPEALEEAPSPLPLSMPHEIALARAVGLPARDGHLPLAAWEQAMGGAGDGQALRQPLGEAWAWLTPCHWEVGRDHIRMDDPQALALSDEESRQALEAMHPYFRQDGVEVTWVSALRWLARGEMLRDLPCASLDRVIGQAVDNWMPRSPQARTLRRLQQEMQMLLYTHSLNDARERERRPTINSFWVSGAGALPQAWTAGPAGAPHCDSRLREAALRGDGPAWRQAWQSLDADLMARLNHDLDAGRPVRLTLCGQSQARSWHSAPLGVWQKLTRLVRAPSAAALLESL